MTSRVYPALALEPHVFHPLQAVRRAQAAALAVVAFRAPRIPEDAPLLAVLTLVDGASALANRLRFLAVRTIGGVAFWAKHPALVSDTDKSRLALLVAHT